MAACICNDELRVRLLLADGAPVNEAQCPGGDTALMMACQGMGSGVVALLLQCGADHGMVRNDDDATALTLACWSGDLKAVQLVSSYGAIRHAPVGWKSLQDMVRAHVDTDVASWLDESQDWSPLHHVDIISPEYALEQLRSGASLHTVAGLPCCTPLDRARQHIACGASAVACEVSALIIAASEPWSPATHYLFPPEARARAVSLLRIGFQLAYSPHFQAASCALSDVWVRHVLPYVIQR